jgi:hypothetical protein
MLILIFFGIVLSAYAVFVVVLTYRYRERGDTVAAYGHAASLGVAGGVAILAALISGWRAYLFVALGCVLVGDAVARWRAARRRRGTPSP